MTTNDTIVLENESRKENQIETSTVNQDSNAAVETEPQKSGSWKQVVISGVAGIALGAASTKIADANTPADDLVVTEEKLDENESVVVDETESVQVDEAESIPTVQETESNDQIVSAAPQEHLYIEFAQVSSSPISIATGVNDNMSFGEAFAAARHEVGSNGAFVWHGQVYTTFYAEEWNALTPAQQQSFSADAIATVNGEYASNEQYSNEDDGIDVHVLGVEENIITPDGELVNVGFAEVEGHNALFIDGDANGTFDLVAVDVNDDGYIDVENEVVEIDHPDLSVEAFNNVVNQDSDPTVDNMYAQMPDYTNDADVSSLV